MEQGATQVSLKISVYIATSLDGFIARTNGDIDWLTGGEGGGEYGYEEFIADIDHVVMGRNTYEKVLPFGGWPYAKKVIVLSSRALTIPPELSDRVEAVNLSPDELASEMEARNISIAMGV